METKKQSLKAWRESRGWTLEELAGRTPYSKSTIGNYENDGRGPLRFYLAMAKSLGISEDQILRTSEHVYTKKPKSILDPENLETLDYLLRDWDQHRLATETAEAMRAARTNAADILFHIYQRRLQAKEPKP